MSTPQQPPQQPPQQLQPMDPAYKARADPDYVKAYEQPVGATFAWWPPVNMIPLQVLRDESRQAPPYPGANMPDKSKVHIEVKQVAGVRTVIVSPQGPKTGEKLPLFVHIHGGGWVLGHPEDQEQLNLIIDYCTKANCVVASIDYRLAPDQGGTFPGAVDDCWNALEQLVKDPSITGGDVTRVAVGGESAGGNLSAIMAIMARDAGIKLRMQLLTIPAVDCLYNVNDPKAPYPSFKENSVSGSVLTEGVMDWFLTSYLPTGVDRKQWKASPLYAPDLSNLAPAVVSCAQLDALRDMGGAYAKKLKEAGNQVTHKVYPGVPHIFPYMDKALHEARQYRHHACEALKKALWENEAESARL